MKNLIKVSALLTALLLISSCTPNTPPIKTGTSSPTTAPTSGATETAEDPTDALIRQYREKTDKKIAEIRKTADPVLPEGATVYYIAPDGSSDNDGKTPEAPLSSIADLENLELAGGEHILFKRGGEYRGYYRSEKVDMFFGAYGEGDKPVLNGSPVNAAVTGSWEPTDAENVYVYSETYGDDIGNIVFLKDDKVEFGIKALVYTRDDGTTYNATTGREFASYADLDTDLHYVHDFYESGKLYVYSVGGSPSDRFGDIELSVRREILNIDARNNTIDNLSFKYCGACAVAGSDLIALTVTNCEFGYIGGSIEQTGEKFASAKTPGRFGNAIQIWRGARDFTVKDCYMYQIYDCGPTFQYIGDGKENVNYKNIEFSGNVIEFANYSIEYFLDGVGNRSTMDNIVFSDNYCWYSGYGLCEQRPDRVGSAHVRSGPHRNPVKADFTIKNNLFAYSKAVLVRVQAEKAESLPVYESNVYIQKSDGEFGYNNTDITPNPERTMFTDAADFAENVLGDKSAVIITTAEVWGYQPTDKLTGAK